MVNLQLSRPTNPSMSNAQFRPGQYQCTMHQNACCLKALLVSMAEKVTCKNGRQRHRQNWDCDGTDCQFGCMLAIRRLAQAGTQHASEPPSAHRAESDLPANDRAQKLRSVAQSSWGCTRRCGQQRPATVCKIVVSKVFARPHLGTGPLTLCYLALQMPRSEALQQPHATPVASLQLRPAAHTADGHIGCQAALSRAKSLPCHAQHAAGTHACVDCRHVSSQVCTLEGEGIFACRCYATHLLRL